MQITNLTVDYSSGTGVSINSGAVQITNVTVDHNSSTGLSMSSDSGTVTTITSTQNSGDGWYAGWSTLTASDVTVQNNGGQGINQGAGQLTLLNLTSTGNSQQGIYAGPVGYCWYSGCGAQTTILTATVESNGGWGLYFNPSTDYWGYLGPNTLDVQNSTFTGNGSGGVYSAGGGMPATIADNLIDSNAGQGLSVNMGSCTVVITGNTVTNNTASQNAALYVSVSGGSLDFEFNLVATNTTTSASSDSVYFNTTDNTSPNILEYNTFANNVAGATMFHHDGCRGHPTIEHNNFLDAANTFELADQNASGMSDLDAANNWWGTTHDAAIQAKMYDFGQNLNLGVIDYQPYLMAVEPGAPTPPAPSGGGSVTPSPTPTGVSGCQGCSIIPGGHINLDTEWTLAGSPYLVTGNLLVVSGVTLTIDPGVVVEFAANRGMQVNGTLIALGTLAQPITLTSAQVSPAPGDWASIIFATGSVGATFDGDGNYLGGSTLQYVSIEYAGGNGATAALKIGANGPYLANLTVTNSQTEGVDVQGATIQAPGASILRTAGYALNIVNGNLTLSNADIENTQGVNANSTAITITNVAITGTSGTGISINSGPVQITNLTVDYSSGTGVSINSGAVQITNVTVDHNSSTGLSMSSDSGTVTTITSTQNSGDCWYAGWSTLTASMSPSKTTVVRASTRRRPIDPPQPDQHGNSQQGIYAGPVGYCCTPAAAPRPPS